MALTANTLTNPKTNNKSRVKTGASCKNKSAIYRTTGLVPLCGV